MRSHGDIEIQRCGFLMSIGLPGAVSCRLRRAARGHSGASADWLVGSRSGSLTVPLRRVGLSVGMARVLPLNKLFIEPRHIRSGAGRALLAHAIAEARRRGAGRLTILADPSAAAFYERAGAVRIGEAPSDAVPGRLLPLYEVRLDSTGDRDLESSSGRQIQALRASLQFGQVSASHRPDAYRSPIVLRVSLRR